MASFDVSFSARTTAAYSATIRAKSEELVTLQSRLLGRSDDLEGEFNSSATEFTDLIGWNIKGAADQDHQQWRDAGVAIIYASSQLELWAQYVDDFREERTEQVDEWFVFRREKAGEIPGKYQGSTISASYPERGGPPFSAERKSRDIYDEVVDKLDDLNERERTNYRKFEKNADEVADNLREGPTKANVQQLIDAGINSWAFYNLDPSKYTMLVDNQELTEENAQEWAEELESYWSGEKPLDERYHELMLMMSMINSNAMQAQQGDTSYREEEMDFLRAFYDELEESSPDDQGVLGIPGRMDGDHLDGEERDRALGVLGDGILALSDHRIGGGYYDLPESVIRAAEGAFLLPGGGPNLDRGTSALAQILGNAHSDMEAGYGLSNTLTLSMGMEAENGSDGHGMQITEEEMRELLDVSTRNRDANHDLLTGDYVHPNFSYEGDEDGATTQRALELSGFENPQDMINQAVAGIFTNEWEDDGETAGQLIDWLADDMESDDESEVKRAGDAFAGFMDMITGDEMYEALTETGVEVTEGEHEFHNATFTQFNTELGNSFVDIFDAHSYSFADSDVLDGEGEPKTGVEDYREEDGFVDMGLEERLRFMTYAMGNDESSESLHNSINAYHQIEAEMFFGHGQEVNAGRGAGTLQGLLEIASDREEELRRDDLVDADYERERKFEVTMGTAQEIAGKIPKIGSAISKGLGLTEEYLGEHLIDAIIDGNYDVSPHSPVYVGETSIDRMVRLEGLSYVARTDVGELDNVVDNSDFKTLVDSGVMTIEKNGREVALEDIDENFHIDENTEISIAKERAEWAEDAQANRGLRDVDQALKNILGDVVTTTYDGREESAEDRVDGYGDEYQYGYDDVNSALDRSERDAEYSGRDQREE